MNINFYLKIHKKDRQLDIQIIFKPSFYNNSAIFFIGMSIFIECLELDMYFETNKYAHFKDGVHVDSESIHPVAIDKDVKNKKYSMKISVNVRGFTSKICEAQVYDYMFRNKMVNKFIKPQQHYIEMLKCESCHHY